MICELCGDREAEMDFNVLTPFSVVEADVCLACWTAGGGDVDVTMALLNKRAERRGIELPIRDRDVFAALCKRETG